jgi:hypothetical protein
VFLIGTGCASKKKTSAYPSAMKEIIQKFSANPPCKDAHVDEFDFQGKTVYTLHPGTCGADMGTEVYDSGGKKLGMLGGFAGKTSINGEDFDKAVFKRTIWKKS